MQCAKNVENGIVTRNLTSFFISNIEMMEFIAQENLSLEFVKNKGVDQAQSDQCFCFWLYVNLSIQIF